MSISHIEHRTLNREGRSGELQHACCGMTTGECELTNIVQDGLVQPASRPS